MDTKRFFLYFIVIAALALAGCGGNGGGMQTAMPDPDPEPPMTCPDGQTGTPPNCVTPGPTVAELFEVAQDARDDATEAGTTATDSVKDATKYSDMLTVDKVRGDSMMAQENAQKVLDARDAVTEAVETSETAVSELEQAEMDAEEHDNDALDRAIAAAMEVAEQAVKDAKAQADSNTLKTAVQAVTGTDEDEPMTAADHAEMVAKAIGGALAATDNTDGSGLRVNFVADITSSGTERPMGEAKYEEDDHQGDTWEQIVGSANVMEKRIVSGTGTKAVMAASVSGMTLTVGGDRTTSDTDTDTDGIQVSDGTQFADVSDGDRVTYKGIPGTVFCQGSDCATVAVAGGAATAVRKLTGSWYFTPTSEKQWYVGTTAADGTVTYAGDNQYARYGYWVSRDAATGNATVNVYAILGVSEAEAATAVTATPTGATAYSLATNTAAGAILTDTQATYSGEAIGLSLYKELNTDGTIADGFPQTGQFTADVELTAKFGDAPSLGGRITNFQGNAVDSTWSVTLRDTAFTGGTIAETANAPALGSATQSGIWTATAYGNGVTTNVDATTGVPTGDATGSDVVSVRPAGIFGHFNTHFTNGHAAGAYATRKD